MKYLPGSASLKLAHGHVRHNIRAFNVRRLIRPAVCFASFVLFLTLFFMWKRYYHYSDYTSALLLSRPNTPLPRRQVFHFSPRHQNGFGAQVLHLLNAAAVAQLMNPPARLCIKQARYWNYGCAPYKGWQCYFKSGICDDNTEGPSVAKENSNAKIGEERNRKDMEDDKNCRELSKLTANNVWTTPCIRVTSHASHRRTAIVTRRIAQEHPLSSLEFIRTVAKPIWQLNDRTARAIFTRLEGAGLNLNMPGLTGDDIDNSDDRRAESEKEKDTDVDDDAHNGGERIPGSVYADGKYVAIHVRRGDKSREVREVNLRAYADAVQLLARPGEPVFVATDDGSIISHLRDLLGPRHYVLLLGSTMRRTGHRQRDHNHVWMKTRNSDVVDLLAEIEAMRRARVFIATFSSNLARLVHVLRKADEHDSISLDDRWAPGVAWLTFGQPYCNWPGANDTFCQLWESN